MELSVAPFWTAVLATQEFWGCIPMIRITWVIMVCKVKRQWNRRAMKTRKQPPRRRLRGIGCYRRWSSCQQLTRSWPLMLAALTGWQVFWDTMTKMRTAATANECFDTVVWGYTMDESAKNASCPSIFVCSEFWDLFCNNFNYDFIIITLIIIIIKDNNNNNNNNNNHIIAPTTENNG